MKKKRKKKRKKKKRERETLNGHDQLNSVEAVKTEILCEVRAVPSPTTKSDKKSRREKRNRKR